MSSNRISFLLPFFKGNSLESEMGFVHYYHYHPGNRLLHMLGIPLLIFGILTMTYAIDYRLSLVFYVSYCSVIFLFDYRAALAYTLLFGLLFGFVMQGSRSILAGFVIFFSGLMLQGLGHYVFQRSTPAFRAFEAVFTTPIFLMMYLITDHNQPFWINIEKETKQWKELLNK